MKKIFLLTFIFTVFSCSESSRQSVSNYVKARKTTDSLEKDFQETAVYTSLQIDSCKEFFKQKDTLNFTIHYKQARQLKARLLRDDSLYKISLKQLWKK